MEGTYQITLPGYDGSNDATDHLIVWVNAPNIKAARIYAKTIGLEDCHNIQIMDIPGMLTFADGVDFVLDHEGNVMLTRDQYYEKKEKK